MTLFGNSYCPVCGMRVLAFSGECLNSGDADHVAERVGSARPTFCEICGQRLGSLTGKCWNAGDLQHRGSMVRLGKNMPRVCPTCLGQGAINNGLMKCGTCGGTGRAGW